MNVQQALERKLNEGLAPAHLEVVNESHQHNVPHGSESHFKVIAVSKAFAGKRSVQRHRMVYQLLREELRNPIHALALHTYSEEEWSEQASAAPDSPLCRGGVKADRGG